jgi:hypothetical protein
LRLSRGPLAQHALTGSHLLKTSGGLVIFHQRENPACTSSFVWIIRWLICVGCFIAKRN